jgi:hypothetical protein
MLVFVNFRLGECMRRFFISLAALVILGCGYALPATALDQYGTEEQAQKHCQKDTVVWLNLPTMIWHYKGQRWYGRTKNGAYVCEKEAAASGARATRNGE